MVKQTPLHPLHVESNGKMVDFAGWDMPLHYGSQVDEHHVVRKSAGIFDVSHMTIVDLKGTHTREFLRYLLANDVARLKNPGKALYSCMLNERGGVIDDLIVYFRKEDEFRVVFNAGTREKALAWVTGHLGDFGVKLVERPELLMLAVQGPQARDKVHSIVPADVAHAAVELTPFNSAQVEKYFIARTGYTGEDGYELMLPQETGIKFWKDALSVGVRPIGLGARDTLRLEAGMNLYGTDMDESVTPLESGLGWTVAWEPAERQFIGRAALESARRDEHRMRLVGLVLEGKGVLRNHQKVSVDGRIAGEITSGSFSPTLGRAIAFARVPRNVGAVCQVDIRGKMMSARVVKPPFVRNGKSCIDLP